MTKTHNLLRLFVICTVLFLCSFLLLNLTLIKVSKITQFTSSTPKFHIKDIPLDASSKTSIFPLVCNAFLPPDPSKKPSATHLFAKRSQETICESDYGCGLLHAWKQNPMVMCDSPGTENTMDTPRKNNWSSKLTCYKHNNRLLPKGTYPHTVCEATNLMIDFNRLDPSTCLKFRPGYFCKSLSYFNYIQGALVGKCQINNTLFDLKEFSKDFGRDIFNSFRSLKQVDMLESDISQIVDGTTIFVSREFGEHVNLFHAMTDFFATHVMIEMFKLDVSRVQVVILDNHYDGPFDFLWNSTFSLYRPAKKALQFNRKVVRFEKSIFQHSGYATQLMSNILSFHKHISFMCHSTVPLVSSFAKRIIHGLNISLRKAKRREMIRILFISRKPFTKNGIDHSFMGRQIRNEDEVIDKISQHPDYSLKFTLERKFGNPNIQRIGNVSNKLLIGKETFINCGQINEKNLYIDDRGDYLTIHTESFFKTFSELYNELKQRRSSFVKD